MGKLMTLPKPGKLDKFAAKFGGSAKAEKLASKAARQAAIRDAVTDLAAGDLEGLFALAEDKGGDLVDKQRVHREVLDLLQPDWNLLARAAALFA